MGAMASGDGIVSEEERQKLEEMEQHRSSLEESSRAWEDQLNRFKPGTFKSSDEVFKEICEAEIEIGRQQVSCMKGFVDTVERIDGMVTGLKKDEDQLTKEFGKDFFDRVFACSQETKRNLMETQFVVMHLKAENSAKLCALEILKEGKGDVKDQLELAKAVFKSGGRGERVRGSRKLKDLQQKWQVIGSTVEGLSSEFARKKKARSLATKVCDCLSVFGGVALFGTACVGGGLLFGVPIVLKMSMGLAGLYAAKAKAIELLQKSVELVKKTLAAMREIAKVCSKMLCKLVKGAKDVVFMEVSVEPHALPLEHERDPERAHSRLTNGEEVFLRVCKASCVVMEDHLKEVDLELRGVCTKIKNIL